VKKHQQMRNVDITSEPIQLYKILKFEGLVSNGGEAKAAVAEGLVRVNGQTETRKRKQIVSGDIIEFGDEKMRIRLI
jgi:ribosome-associated protein